MMAMTAPEKSKLSIALTFEKNIESHKYTASQN